MSSTEVVPEPLVPPRRLGALLSAARVRRGLGLADAAALLGGGWDSIALLEVESGRRRISDAETELLTGLYGITTTTLIPQRSRLVVDTQERTIALTGGTVDLGGDPPPRRQVLSRYLAVVCAMRDEAPGHSFELRSDDIDVLATVLGTSPENVRLELGDLIEDHESAVDPLWSRIRGRLLVPAVGVVVVATAFGALLLVPADSDAAPAGGGEDVEVEIGDAVLQERDAQGNPGPVVVRD